MACGLDHTVAVAAARVFAWGQGDSGQLGLGEQLLEAFRPTEVLPSLYLFAYGQDVRAGWEAVVKVPQCVPAARSLQRGVCRNTVPCSLDSTDH